MACNNDSVIGGALATLAAVDFQVHSVNRVNRYIKWTLRLVLISVGIIVEVVNIQISAYAVKKLLLNEAGVSSSV
jgi:hypothetical protein